MDSPEFVRLRDVEAGFAAAAIPIWVVDLDTWKFAWTNALAREMWRAPSAEELAARELRSDAPNKVLARTDAMIERVRRGERVREEWVFYPRGQPIMVMLEASGVLFDDGRFGLLNQALPMPEMAPAIRRAVTMSRHNSTISALVRPNGEILAQNPAAVQAFGDHPSWLTWLGDPALAQRLLDTAMAGEQVRELIEVEANGQTHWHIIHAHTLRDPITAELGVLIEHTDDTARIEAEQLAENRGLRIGILSETLELVEQQRREILELSAPVLDVGDRTLAVPIIGELGAEQSESIMIKLLDAVSSRGARRVILDLTGVVVIDRHTAGRLRALVGALRLLGATVAVTGIRAELAVRLADAQVDLDGVVTLRSLAEGLRQR